MVTRRTVLKSALALTGPSRASTVYPHRWVLVGSQLRTDAEVTNMEGIVRTCAKHGLNGIILNAIFDRITLQPPAFFNRLQEAKRLCDQFGIEIIPALFSPGYGGGVLSHDPNLAAGFPVRDALFVASRDDARFSPDPPVTIVNGTMTAAEGHRLKGFHLQDGPGTLSFVDFAIIHTAGASLRFENISRAPNRLARLMQQVKVQPYRHYRFSTWLKTEGLETNQLVAQVLSPQQHSLAPMPPSVPGTTGWRQIVLDFNSMDNDSVQIFVGTWWARNGRFWLQDWKIEELGPINILHRPGTPVIVRSESGNRIFEEGRDYEIIDPRLNSRLDHSAPPFRIPKWSHIKEHERLRVSWYHGMAIQEGGNQVSLCLSEPKLYEIWREQARRVQQLLAPRRYLLSMDELRAGGSCAACKKRGLTMARIFGDSVTRAAGILRDITPSADIWCWSDMLDPYANARNYYYLVNGDLTETWKYVPRDLGIMCWNASKRANSLAHFSSLGFRIMAGAYYDAGNLDGVRDWLNALDRTPKAEGILYATFANKYDLLPDFGDLISKQR